MKTVAIQSGKFVTNADGKQNNFSGYTASGQRVNIYSAQLHAIGMKADADLKFPLYALVEKREHTDKKDQKYTRWDAGSVFTDENAMLQASIADASLAIKAQVLLKKLAEESGISEQALRGMTADAF